MLGRNFINIRLICLLLNSRESCFIHSLCSTMRWQQENRCDIAFCLHFRSYFFIARLYALCVYVCSERQLMPSFFINNDERCTSLHCRSAQHTLQFNHLNAKLKRKRNEINKRMRMNTEARANANIRDWSVVPQFYCHYQTLCIAMKILATLMRCPFCHRPNGTVFYYITPVVCILSLRSSGRFLSWFHIRKSNMHLN